jgi:hypothetical protein
LTNFHEIANTNYGNSGVQKPYVHLTRQLASRRPHFGRRFRKQTAVASTPVRRPRRIRLDSSARLASRNLPKACITPCDHTTNDLTTRARLRPSNRGNLAPLDRLARPARNRGQIVLALGPRQRPDTHTASTSARAPCSLNQQRHDAPNRRSSGRPGRSHRQRHVPPSDVDVTLSDSDDLKIGLGRTPPSGFRNP